MEENARVVVGRVRGPDPAREALLGLQRAGVDESDIKLAGDAAVEAQHAGEDPEGKEQIDRALVRHTAGNVVGGVVLGAAAGIVIGAVLGGLALAVADGEWWWVLIPVVVLGVLGTVVGAFIAAERNIGTDDELELTLADVDGPMWIAVRVRNDEDAHAVHEVFVARGIEEIEERTAQARGLHLIEW